MTASVTVYFGACLCYTTSACVGDDIINNINLNNKTDWKFVFETSEFHFKVNNNVENNE